MKTKFKVFAVVNGTKVPVANPGDWFGRGPWLIHLGYFDVPGHVIEADSEQDALDEAVDRGMGRGARMDPEIVQEYHDDGNEDAIAYLGNEGTPHVAEEVFCYRYEGDYTFTFEGKEYQMSPKEFYNWLNEHNDVAEAESIEGN